MHPAAPISGQQTVEERSAVSMFKAIGSFLQTVVITIVVTVLLSAIAIESISQLSAENFELRRQETGTENAQTMACDLHIELLPFFGIDLLSYEIPMEIPATEGYAGAYKSGDRLPIMQFEDCFFLSLYVTAK
jgi:hypothetical protein